MDPHGRPSFLEQGLDVGISKRSELMNKPYPGEELRVTRYSLFDPRHADQHHAKSAFVEDGAQLLKAVHGQAICFINDD